MDQQEEEILDTLLEVILEEVTRRSARCPVVDD